MHWVILGIIVFAIFITAYIKTGLISRKTKVRRYWWSLLFIGWFCIGIGLYTFGAAIILLFVENIHQIISFILIPISVLLIMLMLDQYLPFVSRYSQSNIKETIDFCVQFFDASMKSLKIVSGWLSESFYGNPRIIESLRKAKNRKVSIEIIFKYTGNEVQLNVIEGLSFLTPRVELIPLANDIDGLHFMIVDNLHFRVEKNHHLVGRGREKIPITKVDNIVHYWSPFAAWGLNRRFNILKNEPQASDAFTQDTE